MKMLDLTNQLIVRLILFLFLTISGIVSETPIFAVTSDYHITTYSSKIDDEHENFIWMQDTRIDTTEPLKKELTVGSNWSSIDKLKERIETYFVPYNIMPYSTFLGEGAAVGNNPITVQDVHNYFHDHSNDVLTWLDLYKATLDSIHWSDPSLRQTRYRFYTEADTADNNGLNLEDPEPYIEFLHYFYPMFHSKLPDSTLVVGMCSVRVDYFYAMMKYFHENHPSDTLPFDGVDFHFVNPNWYSGSVDYQFMKSVFDEFGYGNEFGRMKFWAAEATYAPRGFTPRSTFNESKAYGYYNQQEQARHVIKSFASSLALPGMLMVNQGKMFSEEWQPRTLDTIWDTNAHYGNGHSLYEIGLRTPYQLQTSLKWMNDALHDYRPAYNNKASNLRIYDFSKAGGFHRLLVWRDVCYEGTSVTVPVPQEWAYYETADVFDLITGASWQVPIHQNRPRYVSVVVSENPLIISPVSDGGDAILKYGIARVVSDYPGDEPSTDTTLSLSNPNDGSSSVVLMAYDGDGNQIGYPYEMTVSAHGSTQIRVSAIFGDFEGSLLMASSMPIYGTTGYIKTDASVNRITTMPIYSVQTSSSNETFEINMTRDWTIETGTEELYLTLMNPSEAAVNGTLVIFDQAGTELHREAIQLNPFAQWNEDLLSLGLSGKGKIEVQSDNTLLGQLSRFMTGSDYAASGWSEEAFKTDDKRVGKVEVVCDSSSEDLVAKSAVLLNPYDHAITGDLTMKSTLTGTEEKHTITVDAHERIDVRLNADDESCDSVRVEFPEDSEVHCKYVNEMANPNPEEPSIEIETEALGNDASSLLLPYTVITRDSNHPSDTEITLDNTSGLDVTVLIRMFDQDGNLISDLTVVQDVLLAGAQVKYSLSSLLPPAIQDFSGSVVIEASQPDSLSGYAIENRNDPSTGFMSSRSMLRVVD